MENTIFSSSKNNAWAWWFENSRSSTNSAQSWDVFGHTRGVNPSIVSNSYGIRPAIEVSKTNMEY